MLSIFLNHMTGAEIERYPIFSQGFEKSRTPALHHSFVWERPTLSVFSQQQSAQNTQHRHYTEEHRERERNTRVLATRIKNWDCFRKHLFLFQFADQQFESLISQVWFFSSSIFVWAGTSFIFSLFTLYMIMRMENFSLRMGFVREPENGSPLEAVLFQPKAHQ